MYTKWARGCSALIAILFRVNATIEIHWKFIKFSKKNLSTSCQKVNFYLRLQMENNTYIAKENCLYISYISIKKLKTC